MNGDFADLAAGARELKVENRRGDVALRTSDGPEWRLEWNAERDEAPEVTRDGDTVHVRQRTDGGFLPGGLDAPRLDLRLTVPSTLENAELRTGNGQVKAYGLRRRHTLSTGNGSVELRGSSGDATLNTGNGEVRVDEFDGELSASTGNGRVRVDRLRGRLRLNTGNGPVEVLDTEGDVGAQSGNGDLRFIGVGGRAEVNSGHGKIEIEAPRGLELRVNTAMGSIRIDGGTLRGLRANSMVGPVECSAELMPGRYELTTGMGSIGVQLAARRSARVDAQTSFGQVESSFPLVRVGRSGPMGFGGVRMVGSVGEGEPEVELTLRSAKGTLTISSAPESAARVPAAPARAASPVDGTDAWTTPAPAAETPADPSPPVPAAAPVEGGESPKDGAGAAAARDPALEVLERVARGEVTPERAEALLRELRSG